MLSGVVVLALLALGLPGSALAEEPPPPGPSPCATGTGGPSLPLDVAFVLDESGSMSSNDPQRIRVQASQEFVDRFAEGDRGAVVGFASGARILQALTDDVEAIKAALNQARASGGTNITNGVTAGLNQLDAPNNPDRRHVMILLSDGIGSYNHALTDRAVDEGVIVYTIGLGSSIPEALLIGIAEATGGRYFPAAQAEDLLDVFSEIRDETDLDACPAPIPEAGGPYTVPEGGALVLTGSADPGIDPRPLAFAWDLSGDGEFDVEGATPTFDASDLDGPATVEVSLEACNGDGECDTDSATVEVLNVAPWVGLPPGFAGLRGEEVALSGTFEDPAGEADAPFAVTWTVGDDSSEGTAHAPGPTSRTVAFDEPGDVPVQLEVTDKDGATGEASATLHVVNRSPDCSGAAPTVGTIWPPNHRFVDVQITGVTDPDGDEVGITIDAIRQDEPVDHLGDGSFTPDASGVGSDTASLRAERSGLGDGRFYHLYFSATDEFGDACTGTVTVVVPHNRSAGHEPVDGGPLYDSTLDDDPDAPVPFAAPDSYTLLGGQVLDVPAPGVLANDTHAESAALLDAPRFGDVQLESSGAFTYTPEPTFAGADHFTYAAGDADGNTAETIVRITVLPPPDVGLFVYPRAVATGRGTPVDVTLIAGGGRPGDTTFEVVGEPGEGTVTLDGAVATYTPPAIFNGVDQFTYRALRGDAVSEPAPVRVTVTPSNTTPVATGLAVELLEDSSVLVDVLAAAADPDGEPLDIVAVTEPLHGEATVEDGQVRYTPEPDYFGEDNFRYRVADPHGAAAGAGVAVTVLEVNDPPVTSPVSLETRQFVALTVPAADLAAGDEPGPPNEEGQQLTVTAVSATAGTNGTVVLAGGEVTYTPEGAFAGEASFDYTVCDDGTTAGQPDPQCAEGVATVTVVPNTRPVAFDQDVTTVEGEAVAVTLTGDDGDGDPLTFAVVDEPASGALTGTAPELTYTPGAGFTGTDSFTFVADDGFEESPPATVTITVEEANEPPVAVDDEASVVAGESVLIDVLANDSDPDGDALEIVAVTEPASGTAAVEGDGIRYTPDAGFTGTDTFDYTISDGRGGEASATVVVTVTPVNQPPVAADIEVTTAIDVPVEITLEADDPEGDPLTFVIVDEPAHGTLSGDGPALTYTPDSGFAGTDTFTYLANDGELDSGAATVTVTVVQPNRPPVALDQEVATDPDTPVEITLEASDPDGDPLTFQVVAPPQHGSLVGAAPVLTYTPDPGFTGMDAFTFAASDGELDSAPAVVTITVGDPGEPDPSTRPVAADDDYAVQAGAVLDVPAPGVLGNDSDPGGLPLQAALLDGPSDGLVDLRADGSFAYTPDAGFTGTDAFTYEARNPSSSSEPATVSITVIPAEPEPEVVEIVVEPDRSVILTGDGVLLVPTGVRDDGTAVRLDGQVSWDTSDGTVVEVSPDGTALGVAPGQATVTATLDGIQGDASVRVLEPVASSPLPVAEIATPADDAVLTGRADVVGTAADEDFLRYVLDTAPAGSSAFAVLAEGEDPVEGGVLGTFDASMLPNGLHTVRLRVFDRAGQGVSTAVTYEVEGEAKVGTFTLEFRDLTIPAGMLPIEVVRSYDSRDRRRGDFGHGWNLELRTTRAQVNRVHGDDWEGVVTGTFIPVYSLVPAAEHLVTVTLPDGRAERFRMQLSPDQQQLFPITFTTASYAPLPGTLGTLQTLDHASLIVTGGPSGPVQLLDDSTLNVFDPRRFVYTGPDGTRYTLHRTGGLERVVDPNGNTLDITPSGITSSAGVGVSFQRDALGRITEITTPAGAVHRYTYDGNGDLGTYQNPAGDTASYRYDRHHGLLEVRDPTGARPLRTEYGDDGRVVATIDAEGNRVEFDRDLDARTEVVHDARGGVTVLAYDERGNVTSETDALGHTRSFAYDADDNLTEVVDPLGRVTTFDHDGRGNVTAVTGPSGETVTYTYDGSDRPLEITDARGGVTASTYDAAGNPVAVEDAAGEVTGYAYDPAGNLTTVTDPRGAVTTHSYDARGAVTATVDPLGVETTYGYDADGSLTVVETHATDGDGDPLTVRTEHRYDAAGRLTAVVDAEGGETRRTYDAAGRVRSVTDPAGETVSYTYDLRGNVVEQAYPDGTTETFAYDASGNVVSSTDRAGRETVSTYDALDRLVAVQLPDGSETSFEYDEAGQLVAWTEPGGARFTAAYDAVGRPLTLTDPLDGETRFTYEGDLEDPVTVTDPLGGVTTRTYDPLGNLVEVEHPDGTTTSAAYDAAGRPVSETDANGNTTSFTYDAAGRLVTVTDALGGETHYVHDGAGNKVAQTDANGNVTRWRHDRAGRVVERTLPLGSSELFTYDAAGRVTEHTDFAGETTTFAYDAAGRLARTDFPDGTSREHTYTPTGLVATTTEADGETVHTYDDADRLTSITHPDGVALSYAYDAAGNVTELSTGDTTTTYTYDALQRLASVAAPGAGETTFAYDAASRRTQVAHPNGVETTATYDPLGRVTQVAAAHPAEGEVFSASYTLDAAGNVLSAVESGGRELGYTYDALHRLVQESAAVGGGAPVVTGYTYDAVGNRLTRTVDGGSPETYAYDADNRLLEAGDATFAYDGNGNLVLRSDASGDLTLAYDAENRLTAATAPDGTEVAYGYDAGGNRASVTTAGDVRRLVVDANRDLAQVVEERDASGAVGARYVYGVDLLSVAAAGEVAYVHGDRLSTVRALTGADGAVSATRAFDAFGVTTAASGTAWLPNGFTGERLDPVTGLYHLRARDYDPVTGRFTGLDPFQGFPEDPRSLNGYVYGGSNPLAHVDPHGEFFGLGGFSVNIAMRSVLTSLAFNAPFRALELALDLAAGASLSASIQSAAFGLAGDVLLDIVTLGVIGRASRALRIRPSTVSPAQFAARRPANSPWRLNPFQRGRNLEPVILGRPGMIKGVPAPSNYPVIDDFAGGVARSVKTIDVTAPSYQSASAIKSRLNKYLNDLRKWNGTSNHPPISPQEARAARRELLVGFEPGAPNRLQADALREFQEAAARSGITVRLVPVP